MLLVRTLYGPSYTQSNYYAIEFAVEWRRFEVMSIGRESGIVEHYPRKAAIDSGISLKTLLF